MIVQPTACPHCSYLSVAFICTLCKADKRPSLTDEVSAEIAANIARGRAALECWYCTGTAGPMRVDMLGRSRCRDCDRAEREEVRANDNFERAHPDD